MPLRVAIMTALELAEELCEQKLLSRGKAVAEDPGPAAVRARPAGEAGVVLWRVRLQQGHGGEASPGSQGDVALVQAALREAALACGFSLPRSVRQNAVLLSGKSYLFGRYNFFLLEEVVEV